MCGVFYAGCVWSGRNWQHLMVWNLRRTPFPAYLPRAKCPVDFPSMVYPKGSRSQWRRQSWGCLLYRRCICNVWPRDVYKRRHHGPRQEGDSRHVWIRSGSPGVPNLFGSWRTYIRRRGKVGGHTYPKEIRGTHCPCSMGRLTNDICALICCRGCCQGL